MILFLDQTEFVHNPSYGELVKTLKEHGIEISRFYSAVTTAVSVLARTNGDQALLPYVIRDVLHSESFSKETYALVWKEFKRLLALIDEQMLSLNHTLREDNYTLCFHKYNHLDMQILAFRMNSLANIL